MFFIHLKEQVQPFICQSVYTGNAVCFWLTENNRFIIAICTGTGQHFAPDVSDPINVPKKWNQCSHEQISGFSKDI